MDKNLKNYLEEIDHYLILKEGKKEVLEEIESHILEKTEKDFGEISEENIQKTINLFGSAKEVAEKYLEGFQIISPLFNNYLFRYTWILFAIHYSLKIISYAFNVSFNVSFNLLFFDLSIKVNGFMQLLSEALVTWIYDFGIVALILYLITQSEKEINLIWPQFVVSKFKIKTLPLNAPSKLKIGIIVGLQIISLLVYFKYNTLFFKTYWTNLINNSVYLVVAIFLLNYPFKEIFIHPSLDVLRPIGSWILIGIIVFVVFDLFKVLISIVRTKEIDGTLRQIQG